MATRIYKPEILLALLLVANSPGIADKVVLHSGREIVGKVKNQTPREITIQTQAGRVTLPSSQVKKVEKQSAAQTEAEQFAVLARSGRLEKIYPLLKEQVLPYKDAELWSQREAYWKNAPDDSFEAVAALIVYAGAEGHAANPPFELWVARYFSARGEQVKALSWLAPVRFQDIPANFRQAALDILLASKDALLADVNSRESQSGFALLAGLQQHDPSGHASLLLQMKASEKLARQGNTSQAISLLQPGNLAQTPHALHEQILRILRSAPSNTTETAVTAYQVHQKLGPSLRLDQRLELATLAHQALLAVRLFSQATSVADAVSGFAPDAGARLQHLATYRERLWLAGPHDPVGRYKAAIFARQMGLYQDAATELRDLLKYSAVAENARLQLDLVLLEQGRQQLAQLKARAESLSMDQLSKEIESFRKEHPEEELQRRASELLEISRYREWSNAKREPAQLEAAIQQAERLYNQGRYQECVDACARLSADADGAPTLLRISRLRDRATTALQRLSQGYGIRPPGSAP